MSEPFHLLSTSSYQVFTKTNNYSDLHSYISPDDIIQSRLGDCYLLSAISSLAYLHPKLIFDLFVTVKPNKQGVYAIKLCFNGQWQIIVLDDHFPVRQLDSGAFKLQFA